MRTTTTDAPTDRVAALVTELHDGITTLTSGEDWQRYLAVAARFHRYSFLNTLAILTQRPDATRVAGYQRWQTLGRQVRRGEHGIRILAPCTYRTTTDDPSTADRVSDDNATRTVLRGWKVARVFDVSQTEGDPLPEVPVAVLDGDAPAGLRDQLAGLIRAEGFTFILGPLPEHPGAFGVTHHLARTVIVRGDVPPAQQAKTTAHELAHVLLHGEHRGTDFDRSRAEIEAESVAFVVCAASGLATGAYSFGYVASWSAGQADVIRSTAERVLGCARRVLDALGLDGPDRAE